MSKLDNNETQNSCNKFVLYLGYDKKIVYGNFRNPY